MKQAPAIGNNQRLPDAGNLERRGEWRASGGLRRDTPSEARSLGSKMPEISAHSPPTWDS